MRAITFYSYKGGVGRTLTLANIAHYLARLGQRVVALDLDLEAPGLHYKLPPVAGPPSRGVLDLIEAFRDDGSLELEGALAQVKGELGQPGSLTLLGAGSSRVDYWARLGAIAWHRLLVGAPAGEQPDPHWDGRGREFFLVLKHRIAELTRADFLLIDSRTGITPLGGLAVSQLADDLVCMFAHNQESVDGTTAVARSVGAATTDRIAPRGQTPEPVRIFPVVVRLPRMDTSTEHALLQPLTEQLATIANTEPLTIVHSQPELQVREQVLLASGDRALAGSQTFLDYVRLFNRVVPPSVINDDVQRRVDAVLRQAYDDPRGATQQLEAIAENYPHEISIRALLKFHRLTRQFDWDTLDWSQRLVAHTDRPDDPLVWDLVKATLDELELGEDPTIERLEFVARTWTAGHVADWKVGIELAKAWVLAGELDQGHAVLRTLASHIAPTDAVGVAEVLRAMESEDLEPEAIPLIHRAKEALRHPETLRVSARIAVAVDDAATAELVLDHEGAAMAFRDEIQLQYRLMRVAGRSDEMAHRAQVELADVTGALRRDGMSRRIEAQIRSLHRQYAAMNRSDELWRALSGLALRSTDASRLRELEKHLMRADDDQRSP